MKITFKKVKVIIAIISVLIVASLLTLFLFRYFNKEPKLQDLTLEKIEITYDDKVIDRYDAQVQSVDFTLGVRINDGADISNCVKPVVKWEFVGKTDTTISNAGLVHVGNAIQDVEVMVSVIGVNKLTKTIPFSIIPKQGTTLQSISAVTEPNMTQDYIEGQVFDKKSISVWGNFGSYFARLTGFTANEDPLTATSTDVLIKYGDMEFSLPVSVKRKTLQSIEIITAPDKVEYIETQKFDKTGLKVKANYEYLSEVITDFNVDETTPLQFGDRRVVVSYTFNDITKQTTQEIVVSHRVLSSITISGDVKKEYVQGAKFDPTGLQVTANFEVVESEIITNYEYDKLPLMGGTEKVTISYTENGVTKYADVEGINVLVPYSAVRRVKINSPENVSLNWTYNYISDQLEEKSDYNNYTEHSLLFDVVAGEYDVPVGAVVTLTATNSAVSGFVVDDTEILLDYPNNYYLLDIVRGTQIEIGALELPGNRFVVRFVGDNKDKSFVYGKSWAEPLRTQDLQIVLQLFSATSNYYYEYIIDETPYSFAELSNISFNKKTIVVVEKKNIVAENKVLTLNYYDNFTATINEDVSTLTLATLPSPSRAGYTFKGWSKTSDGESIDDATLSEYLSSASESYVLYALWEKIVVDYSGSKVVGTWTIEATRENVPLKCTVTFNSDGTFTYEVMYDSVKNNSYLGFYSVKDNVVTILSAETSSDVMLISKGDFMFKIVGEDLSVCVFIIENYAVNKMDLSLAKSA